MNDGMQDVIMAAVGGSGRRPLPPAAERAAPQLRAVDGAELAASAAPAKPQKTMDQAETVQLKQGGLRLAFLLSGFHEALTERVERGGRLTEHEESLLSLSRKDFASMRPQVIGLAIERLHAVIARFELTPAVADGAATRMAPMDVFAIDTLANLSRRAAELLLDEGPDAALSLFGDATGVIEPLAIFQQVFSAALGVAEAFARIIDAEARQLMRLAEAIGSEIERI